MPGCAIGPRRRQPKLSEGQMAALKAVVLAGPDPAVDKIVRWRVVDLCRWVKERWGISYSETGMLRPNLNSEQGWRSGK